MRSWRAWDLGSRSWWVVRAWYQRRIDNGCVIIERMKGRCESMFRGEDTYNEEEVAGSGFGNLIIGTEEPKDLIITELATRHLKDVISLNLHKIGIFPSDTTHR